MAQEKTKVEDSCLFDLINLEKIVNKIESLTDKRPEFKRNNLFYHRILEYFAESEIINDIKLHFWSKTTTNISRHYIMREPLADESGPLVANTQGRAPRQIYDIISAIKITSKTGNLEAYTHSTIEHAEIRINSPVTLNGKKYNNIKITINFTENWDESPLKYDITIYATSGPGKRKEEIVTDQITAKDFSKPNYAFPQP
ncbi:MAG: hypothetical protein ACP5N3_02430 [Candidatus Nanoarchaeia archaeon]